MAGYLCPMPNGIFSCHRFPLVWCLTASSLLTVPIWCIGTILLAILVWCLWHHFITIEFPQYYFFMQFHCCWALQIPMLDTRGFQIRVNENLSNNIRILSPKNGGYWSRKGHSVEKTSIFDVFRNVLNDKWLHEFKTVNGRFAKY